MQWLNKYSCSYLSSSMRIQSINNSQLYEWPDCNSYIIYNITNKGKLFIFHSVGNQRSIQFSIPIIHLYLQQTIFHKILKFLTETEMYISSTILGMEKLHTHTYIYTPCPSSSPNHNNRQPLSYHNHIHTPFSFKIKWMFIKYVLGLN